VQMEDSKRMQPTDLTSIYVRGRDGQLNQLSNLVVLREAVAPKELNHFNKLRAAVINGNVGPGYTLGQALDEIDSVVKQELPSTTITDLDGQAREFRVAQKRQGLRNLNRIQLHRFQSFPGWSRSEEFVELSQIILPRLGRAAHCLMKVGSRDDMILTGLGKEWQYSQGEQHEHDRQLS